MPDVTPRKMGVAIRHSINKHKHFRKNRLALLSEYAGRFYRADGSDPEKGRARPINLIHQAATSLVPNLAFKTPKVRIACNYKPYRFYGELLELAVNHLIGEIKLKKQVRQAIVDSVFLCGWMKVGLGVSDKTLDFGDGEYEDVGQPFADRVDPDDMLIDPMARSLDEVYWIGNRFRLSKHYIEEMNLYPKDKLDQLPSRFEGAANSPETSALSHKTSDIRGSEINELTEYVDLCEIYLPKEGRIVTCVYDEEGHVGDDWIREVDYDGPESGPYHQLGFAYAPDNLMPIAPAGVWYDLHMLTNKLARKMGRQADRSKSVLAYEATSWEDASEIMHADDGDSIRVDNIEGIKEIGFGGAMDAVYKGIDWAKAMFSETSLNIDLLSGQSNPNTATQAELEQANINIRMADMQESVYEFVGDICKSLAYWVHTDPLIDMPLVKRDPGGKERQVFYTPEVREGDWLDYNITVVPFSMARMDPNTKVRRLMEFAGNILPAAANAANMLGGAFNLESFIEIIGREMGIEELSEIINTEYLGTASQRMQEMLEAGIPMSASVIKTLLNPADEATGQVGMGEMGQMGQAANMANQPNPRQAMPNGMDPQMERNQMRQEGAPQPAGVP